MTPTVVVGDVHGCLDELRELIAACGVAGRLVLAGDLVAKGPDSQGVLQLARESGALAVLGNHDAHALKARAQGTSKPERQQLLNTLTPPDWAYLEALPLFIRLDAGNVVVHAGAVPGIPFEQQSREHLIAMRSIRDDGTPSKRIEGRPWAAVWNGPEQIVFGHDAVRGLQQYPFATGLDTGCVYGGRLTAIVLPERRLVSVPARRAYVTG